MVSTLGKTLCHKCTKSNCIAMCFGCHHSFCTKHFIKHRLHLSQQMDELNDRYELFQRDLTRENFAQSLLSKIYTWERKSIRKIQEMAEKVRNDVRQSMEKTKNEVQILLKQITAEFETNSYTEIEIERWTNQLTELQNILEKPPKISLVREKKSSSSIRGIKIIEHQQHQQQEDLSNSVLIAKPSVVTFQEPEEPMQEHFVSMFGPCRLSEDNSVVTHSSYRGGLSQISGINQYSSGKHSIDFLIEKKGIKNIFIGIMSSSQTATTPTFDYSVHGWWNLDYAIINGESIGGDTNEILQIGDQITLTIDCDNHQIQLEHHRTKRLVHLPIKLDVCPFPWKILVRLLTKGDSVRILRYL